LQGRILGTLLAALLGGAAPCGAQTLTETVERAVRTFPDLRAAEANRRAVEETLPQARSQLLPSLDGTLGRGREWSDNSLTRAQGGDVSLTRGEAQVTLSQLLYDGGAALGQLRRQRARSQAAAEQVASLGEAVAQRAAEVFFEVLRLQALVSIAQQNLAVHRRTFEQVSIRTEKGVGRRSDDRQAEARLALAQASLSQLSGQLDEAVAAYRHITGIVPVQLLRGDAPLGALPVDLQAALGQAVATHPAVRAAEQDLRAAEQERESARDSLWPRVTLELGATRNTDIDGIPGANYDRTAMLRLRQNLYRGGADSARVREAGARREEALARLGRARIDVERDVRQAWDGLAAARGRLEALRLHADASAEVVEAYRGQFSIGQRSLLDVLNAENESFAARSNYVSGDFAVSVGAYRLLAAMGRMLEHLGVRVGDNT
jgi:adhesin transport system outer membrane protein